tara:strand:- start:51 stop:602 length:552 start_codon:yes stop_codon:yes gene_type:complete
MDAIIINNFFDNFQNIKDEFKKIPLLTLDEMNKKYWSKDRRPENWPGKRSESFAKTNPFLFNLIFKELVSKTGDLFKDKRVDMHSCVHLRLASDNYGQDKKDGDFIHDDPCDYTLMVYLSDTNLKSGTALYPPRGDVSDVMANFVQNRAFLFKGGIRHMAIHNHGDSIENGRLTLNCFIHIIK